MIQKRINLFTQKINSSQKSNVIITRLRIVAMAITTLSFLSIIAVFAVQTLILNLKLRTERGVEIVRQDIASELEKQFPSHLVGVRVQAMSAASKQDINFISGEERIKDFLDMFGIRASLASVSMQTKSDFTADLSFVSQTELLNFVRALEQEEALTIFANAKIGDFVVSRPKAVASGEASLNNNSITLTGRLL